MAKPMTTPLEQTARLLDLVPFLISHQGISLTDLAKHFNIDTEAMLDDLNTLWMCGLPGYTPLELIDLAFDSGYVTIHNAAPLAYTRTLSSSEIVALALGLDLLREDSLQLAPEQRVRIDTLSKRLREQIGVHISITSGPTTTHRSVVATSIARRIPVDLAYYSINSDEETKRIVTAYDFFRDNDVEYFQGYCHTSRGMRTFRVDRIVSVALSESEKVVPETKAEKTERVRIRATLRSLDRACAEAFGLAFSDLRLGESLTLQAFSQEWLVRSIFAGAGSMVIEEPQEIRVRFRQSIDATMALYQ